MPYHLEVEARLERDSMKITKLQKTKRTSREEKDCEKGNLNTVLNAGSVLPCRRCGGQENEKETCHRSQPIFLRKWKPETWPSFDSTRADGTLLGTGTFGDVARSSH